MNVRNLFAEDDRGFVMITVGAALFAIVSLFAVVADLGHIYVTKAQLQNTADAAALAAVVEVHHSTEIGEQMALDFGESHWVAGSLISISPSDIEFGNFGFQTQLFDPGAEPTNSARVTAKRTTGSDSGAVPLFFAPLFGKETSNVQASATAALDPHVIGVQGKNRLIPYSVIDFIVDADQDGKFDIGQIINIHPRNDAPGNFGFLDLDMGSNDVPELRFYIEEGYDKDFVIPPGGSVEVSGSTGINGNSLLNSFNVILGEVVFLPVHDRVDSPGDNAIFNVIAILAVRIHDIKLNGNIESRYIQTEIVQYASSVLVVDPTAGENNSVFKPRLVN